jgi:hypothetical protein
MRPKSLAFSYSYTSGAVHENRELRRQPDNLTASEVISASSYDRIRGHAVGAAVFRQRLRSILPAHTPAGFSKTELSMEVLEGVEIVVFAYILVFLCDRYAGRSEQLPVLLGPQGD